MLLSDEDIVDLVVYYVFMFIFGNIILEDVVV